MTIVIAGVLWMMTATYAVELKTLPSLEACIAAATAVQSQLDVQPRPTLGRVICVPFPIAVEKPGVGI